MKKTTLFSGERGIHFFNIRRKLLSAISVFVAFAFAAQSSMNANAQTSVVAWGDDSYGQTNIPPGLTNVVSVVAGNTFILAVKNDGTIVAWGSDTSGEINVPAGLSNVVAVAAGNNFSVALQNNGTVVAWGDNSYGATNVPAGLSNVVAIAACNEHVDALESDGTDITWGYYLGPASSQTVYSNIVAISDGQYTTMAIQNNGMAVGWGVNGGFVAPAGVTNLAAIAGGDNDWLAVSDGDVLAWGFNDYGEANVPADLTNAVSVAAGVYFNMALRNDGTVVAWGDNTYGETNVPEGLTNVVDISAEGNFAVALVNNGAPVITSQPFIQQIYTGQAIAVYATTAGAPPLTYQWQCDGTNIEGATNDVLIISNAGDYSFVVSNAFGSVTSSNVPVSVLNSPPFLVTQLAGQASFLHSNVCFNLNLNGSLPMTIQWYFNGTNLVGQTNGSLMLADLQFSNEGIYSATITNSYGSLVSSNAFLSISHVVNWGDPGGQPPGLTNVTAICGLPNQAAAVEANGNIVCWPSPGLTTVSGITGAVAIIAGFSEPNMALLANGNAIQWETWGALGLANPVATNVVQIAAWNRSGDLELRSDGTLIGNALFIAPPPSNVVAIASGYSHCLALRSDGTMVAWGTSGFGQATVPPGISNVIAIAAGEYHDLALLNDGTVISWEQGENGSGVTNVPPGLSNVVAIAAGAYHSMALKADGTVVAWGQNDSGQTNVPGGLSNVVAIAAGSYASLALVGNGPPLPDAVAGDFSFRTNTFRLTVPTQSSHVYALDFNRNLAGTNWTLLPLSAGTGTNLVLSDTNATNSTRVYRVRRW